MPKRQVIGLVTSDKMNKSRRVEIERLVQHPQYGKFMRRSTVCHVHDENNESHEGDVVEIIKSRAAQPQPLKYQQTGADKPAEPQEPEAKEPAVKLTEAAKNGELLTLALRYKEPEGFESTRIEFTLPAKAASFNRASPDFQFAASGLSASAEW